MSKEQRIEEERVLRRIFRRLKRQGYSLSLCSGGCGFDLHTEGELVSAVRDPDAPFDAYEAESEKRQQAERAAQAAARAAKKAARLAAQAATSKAAA